MTSLAFTVYGEARPQGSTRAFTPKGWKRPILTSDNPNLKAWRQLVAEAANLELHHLPPNERQLMTEGVRLTIAFYLPRPKSLPKRTTAHVKKPDVDKLVRSVGDSLTGVLFRDDSQICELVTGKYYAPEGQPPRVFIHVQATEGVRPVVVPAVGLPLFERSSDGRRDEHARA